MKSSTTAPGRTIREIGGEVWAERRRLPEDTLSSDAMNQVIDIVMGVPARHDGSAIKNDSDLPVAPLRLIEKVYR